MLNTITFHFLVFGLAQLVYGQLAHTAGRKLPAHAGLGPVTPRRLPSVA